MIDNDTSAMSYVLKDHIESLYVTITNGEVEHYSFDAWDVRETITLLNMTISPPPSTEASVCTNTTATSVSST